MATTRENKIRKAVEETLYRILHTERNWDGELKKKEPPPKETMQALSLGIKYLAVSAKLAEADWGKDIEKLIDENTADDPAKELEPEEEREDGDDKGGTSGWDE